MKKAQIVEIPVLKELLSDAKSGSKTALKMLVAAIIGKDIYRISLILSGTNNLTLENILGIAQALKVHPSELFNPLDIV